MKIISLNIWGGRVFQPLMDFFKKQASDTDIFCLQEVFNNPPHIKSQIQPGSVKEDIYQDIAKMLKDFDGYLAPTQDGEESLCMFIRKSVDILDISDKFVYRWRNAMINNDASTYGINLQYAKLGKNGQNYIICNLHGHWKANFKGDNPARLEQSENIKLFLDSYDDLKIICGDFNLLPSTKSMAILEQSMRNLVKEYKITSTRSCFYTKKHKFADYIMVSPQINVREFAVMQDVVSDHLPLVLEFA